MDDLQRLYISKILFRRSPPAASYLNYLPVIRHLQRRKELPLKAPVTFLVGENGTGKSTLLEAIAVAFGFNAEGGTRNFSFTSRSTHSELHDLITLVRHSYPRDGFYLRAESFYNMASYIDDDDSHTTILRYGGVSLHKQSHGESFMAVMENGFKGNGLYILDEPEAALSPMRQMKMLVLIDELVKQNSQFIISTHSPILMAYPGADIFELTKKGIQSVPYREAEHYTCTRRFLECPEKMLKYLLEEQEGNH